MFPNVQSLLCSWVCARTLLQTTSLQQGSNPKTDMFIAKQCFLCRSESIFLPRLGVLAEAARGWTGISWYVAEFSLTDPLPYWIRCPDSGSDALPRVASANMLIVRVTQMFYFGLMWPRHRRPATSLMQLVKVQRLSVSKRAFFFFLQFSQPACYESKF